MIRPKTLILPLALGILCAAAPILAIKPSALACEGCHGVVSELHERLRKPAAGAYSSRVPRQLEKICSLDSLVKYVFSPPKMVKACNELLGSHKAAIQKNLIRQFEDNPKVTLNQLEEDICFTISEACKGIKKSPDDNLKKTIEADHVLKPEENQQIVFEKDGDKIIPKTTTVEKDMPKKDPKNTDLEQEKIEEKRGAKLSESKDSKAANPNKSPKPNTKVPVPDRTKSDGESAKSKKKKTEL